MPALLNIPIKHCRPSEDIVPFSECRKNLSALISRSRETHRPILITQNGRASSYLIDAVDFDNLMERMELSRDIATSRRELAEGKGITHEQVMEEMDKLLADIAPE